MSTSDRSPDRSPTPSAAAVTRATAGVTAPRVIPVPRVTSQQRALAAVTVAPSDGVYPGTRTIADVRRDTRRRQGRDPGLRLLGQYPTPPYIAEGIIEKYFHDLGPQDLVLEPTCGDGSFLAALPPHVQALGVELDPHMAALARERSGRPVLVGDIRSVHIPVAPTAIIGNPPFSTSIIDAILDRAHTMLPDEGRVGFILPTSIFQAASRVMRYHARWGLFQEMIPRSIYPRIRQTLCFALFTKTRRRTMVGFAFYREADAVQRFAPLYRSLLERHAPQTWRAVVEEALQALGGEATIQDIYATIEGRRPTANTFWREKVRQQLQLHCRRIAKGRYALRAAA